MFKLFFITVLLTLSLYAQMGKFQVIADNISTKNNILTASGNVVVFSSEYYITAQKVIYNKESGIFELFDDVIILKDNNIQTKSNYASLNVNNDDLYQKPSMFFENLNEIWINSKDSKRISDNIFLDKSIISSCNCVDPDWSIRTSSANYDAKDKWINSYNTRIYVKDIPILYTPYLGFSIDNTRRTGLLTPKIGYSKREGFIYSQPIFIAPAPNYDFELIPQFMAKRGLGMYAYYRYADSKDSILKISTGNFREREKYQSKYKLRNDNHYGLNIDYKKFNLFTNRQKDKTDGLYVDINYLNDVEYKTLEDDKYKKSVENKIESKINYIYNTPKYYLGSYFRYYVDTTKESNDNTLQELPKLQGHLYTKPLFLEKLLYSTDVEYTNYTRRDGLGANQYKINLPISYSFSLFDDYLTLTTKQELLLNKYNYKNSNTPLENGLYVETNSIISLNTDLIKSYDNYIHTLNFETDYIHNKKLKEEGDLYKTLNNIDLSSFTNNKSKDSIKFGLNHSFYDKNKNQIFNHKIKQSILRKDSENKFRFQNLENKIVYNYILGSLKNKIVYNFEDNSFIENSSSFDLTYEKFYFKLAYYNSKNTPNSYKEDLESYSFNTKYKFNDEYSFGYFENYNLEKEIRTNQNLAFSIHDKCWDLEVKYKKEIEPASTISGEPIKQDIIYFQLFLKPLGGIIQEYEVDND